MLRDMSSRLKALWVSTGGCGQILVGRGIFLSNHDLLTLVFSQSHASHCSPILGVRTGQRVFNEALAAASRLIFPDARNFLSSRGINDRHEDENATKLPHNNI